MDGAVELDPTGRYRYSLSRRWDTAAGGRLLNVVMLNPSRADGRDDDPTLRRCVGFARRWGFAGLTVTNLYAYRSPDPRTLRRVADPVGPANDAAINAAACGCTVLAAWGVHARPDRVAAVAALLGPVPVFCLGVTRDGHPRHPLYVRGDTPLQPYTLPGAWGRVPGAGEAATA